MHAKDNNVDNDALQQKTSKSVSKMVWKGAEDSMRFIAQLVDNWERIGNTLIPIPPFQRSLPRILLALCLVLPLLGSFFVTSYLMAKGLGFGIGIALFGSPGMTRVNAVVARNYPRIRKYLELRNSILRGVPTNAQLAITLLRMGEHSKAPVPPPTPTDSTSGSTPNGQKPSKL